LGEINRVVTLSSAASDFTHYAKALMASRFQRREAAAVPDLSARVKTILTKAGVGSTDGSTWGSELVGYREISAGFAASLSPWSSYDQILNQNALARTPRVARGAELGRVSSNGASALPQHCRSKSSSDWMSIHRCVPECPLLAHSGHCSITQADTALSLR
jgi:hypothetical protein